MKIRLGHAVAGHIKIRGRPAVDLNRDLFGPGSDLHLGREGQRNSRADKANDDSIAHVLILMEAGYTYCAALPGGLP